MWAMQNKKSLMALYVHPTPFTPVRLPRLGKVSFKLLEESATRYVRRLRLPQVCCRQGYRIMVLQRGAYHRHARRRRWLERGCAGRRCYGRKCGLTVATRPQRCHYHAGEWGPGGAGMFARRCRRHHRPDSRHIFTLLRQDR